MVKERIIPSTYVDAGIDLRDEADILHNINNLIKGSFQFGDVLAKEGHYANMIKFGDFGLALTTDGVGTKLIVAQKMKKYDTVGIDCVAMNVNDLLAMGVTPKAFVDYLAVSEIELTCNKINRLSNTEKLTILEDLHFTQLNRGRNSNHLL